MARQAEIQLAVSGMTCDGCAHHVVKALKSVAGVQTVNVPDWKAGEATVMADESLDDQTLIAALAAAGYSGTIRERHLTMEGSASEFFLETREPPLADSCCVPAARVAEQPVTKARTANLCPVCGEKGKPVQGQTVKALLSVSLRQVRDVEYLFCRTPSCRIVYFSSDGEQTFAVEQVRERAYQKEPNAEDVFVCYCFRHTVGEMRAASTETRAAIVDDINKGITLEQCACDLRNPQGSCCLGNVRGLIKQIEGQM